MFEDLMPETPELEEILYICSKAKECGSEFCLHKEAHYKTELGRPDQPEQDDPCDCSIHECKAYSTSEKVFCVPA